MSVQEPQSQVGGKWSSGDSLDEQVESAEFVGEFLDFENSYNYDESDIGDSKLNTAVVRGFWIEESESASYDWSFVANMELRGQDREMVTLYFPFDEKPTNTFINRNVALQEFLKIFGVDSGNVESIIGRKCLYQDLRTEDDNNDLDFGLSFYNSRRTYWSFISQKLSLVVMITCTLTVLPLGLIGMNGLLVWSLIISLVLGVGMAGVDIVYRRFDSHGMYSVKNYLIG